MAPRRTAVLLATVALALPPAVLRAQVRASERATVSQTVDGTTITVNYSRPRLRGRTVIFGKQVPWTEIWTPGADMATTLAASKDVTIDGHPVPKGKYSVWVQFDAPARWTLVLDRDTTLFHTQGPKARDGQIRFPARVEQAPPAEVLTWSFPEVTATRMRLEMAWEKVRIPLEIKVQPTHTIAVAPEIGRRLEGRYLLHMVPDPADTVPSPTAARPKADTTFTVRYVDGHVSARMDPPFDVGYEDWVLVRVTDDWYFLGRTDREGLSEVWDFFTLEFDVKDGRATGFEIREKNDHLLGTAVRSGG